MYLLDTHAVMWWVLGEQDRFGARFKSVMKQAGAEIVPSAISIAEIAVKRSIGKTVPAPNAFSLLRKLGVEIVPIKAEHAELVAHLPLHHRDPWDRLLIAQAIHEGATLVTKDEDIQRYDVPTIW